MPKMNTKKYLTLLLCCTQVVNQISLYVLHLGNNVNYPKYYLHSVNTHKHTHTHTHTGGLEQDRLKNI